MGQPTERVDWNGRDVTKKLSQSTKMGASFRGESTPRLIQNENYSIVCGIEFHNWTKFNLTEPSCSVKWGHISFPPVLIEAGRKEVMIAHKYGYTMTGSSGIASWLINNDRRVVILWSSPYFSKNTLAVGLTKGNQRHDRKWYDNIINRKTIRDVSYEIIDYKNTCEEIMEEDDAFQVLGSMGTSSKPVIKIILRPKYTKDLSLQSSS